MQQTILLAKCRSKHGREFLGNEINRSSWKCGKCKRLLRWSGELSKVFISFVCTGWTEQGYDIIFAAKCSCSPGREFYPM